MQEWTDRQTDDSFDEDCDDSQSEKVVDERRVELAYREYSKEQYHMITISRRELAKLKHILHIEYPDIMD
jgi:hypothetical protein